MPNSTRISRNRHLAFRRQDGRCIYCSLRMFLGSLDVIAMQLGISRRAASLVQCTAEHLLARQDAGTDSAGNIAAAHGYCNRLRHRRRTVSSPDAFERYVQRRVSSGKWWPDPIKFALNRLG